MAEVKVPRFMISAPGSGSGKTTIVCGLLKALMEKGLSVAAFKSGPDYIDRCFILVLSEQNPAIWICSCWGRQRAVIWWQKMHAMRM